MNPIQSKIEQTSKDYLNYKALFEKEAESSSKKSESLAQESLGLTDEEVYAKYFDIFGTKELLFKDMLTEKTKLYHEINLVKDVIEIPQEILELIKDYSLDYTYAIIGDELKVLDTNKYNDYRKHYIEGSVLMNKAVNGK